ncbi:hypothetical protein FRB95_011742 [Tulasnella sp. JGI-2019a]|nr:hypothetical protein FRB95_011742 [Tulasnella sp. JGI-2019a]
MAYNLDANRKRKPLSFHAVSFGTEGQSVFLRRMVAIADQVAQGTMGHTQASLVRSEYTDAIDTIHLAETFLNIANSLKKPRAHLIRS